MRGLLVKELSVIEVMASELDEYYNLIGCDTIDIVRRRIGGKYFDIICDDEALLKPEPIPTMFDTDKQPIIFGNVIIAGEADAMGEMTDLTNEDIELIIENLGILSIGGKKYGCVLNVKY